MTTQFGNVQGATPPLTLDTVNTVPVQDIAGGPISTAANVPPGSVQALAIIDMGATVGGGSTEVTVSPLDQDSNATGPIESVTASLSTPAFASVLMRFSPTTDILAVASTATGVVTSQLVSIKFVF
jgi:hypothetical protein